MMLMWDRFAEALLVPVAKAIVVLLGTYTLIWGCWLACPWFSVFAQAGLYSQMAAIAPEYGWGAVAITCGLGMLWGALRPSYKALALSAGVGFMHWFVVAIFYFLGDALNTGGITSLFLALYAGYLYLNTRLTHRKDGRWLDGSWVGRDT